MQLSTGSARSDTCSATPSADCPGAPSRSVQASWLPAVRRLCGLGASQPPACPLQVSSSVLASTPPMRMAPAALAMPAGALSPQLSQLWRAAGVASAHSPHTHLCRAGAGAAKEAVMVVDMGTHMLRGVPGLHLVVQLLAPGLEGRAQALPPLNSTYASPGTPCVLSGRPYRHACTEASSLLPAGAHEPCPPRIAPAPLQARHASSVAHHTGIHAQGLQVCWQDGTALVPWGAPASALALHGIRPILTGAPAGVQGILMPRGQLCVRLWKGCLLASPCPTYLCASVPSMGTLGCR